MSILKSNLIKLIVILFSIINVSPTFSQRNCGADVYGEFLNSNYPNRQENIKSVELQLIERSKINTVNNKSNKLLKIPVVVHVIGSTVISTVNSTQIQNQIDILNDEFSNKFNNHANAVDMRIEFCLAQFDPQGNSTSGILNIYGTYPNYDYDAPNSNSNSDLSLKSLSHWEPTKYLNLYVANLSNGVFGYASFPWDMQLIPQRDGVVIDPDYFDLTSNSRFGGGKTAVHEVGHWLGLYHTFQRGRFNDESACVNDDCKVNGDLICDTPPVSTANAGCPVINSCNTDSPDDNDLVENYMDYTDDNCLVMFTNGQKTRARYYLQWFRFSDYFASCVPHCNNGIKDQDETGIDCGGFDCPPCQSSHCINGVQDQDEQGVDCGGANCPPCTSAQLCNNKVKDGNETRIDCGGACGSCSDRSSVAYNLRMTISNRTPDENQTITIRLKGLPIGLIANGMEIEWSIRDYDYNTVHGITTYGTDRINYTFAQKGIYHVYVYFRDINNSLWSIIEWSIIVVGGYSTEYCIPQAYYLNPITGSQTSCSPYHITGFLSSGTKRKERWSSEDEVYLNRLTLDGYATLDVSAANRINISYDPNCPTSKVSLHGNFTARIRPIYCGSTRDTTITNNPGSIHDEEPVEELPFSKFNKDNDELDKIIIFPNPTKGLLNVQINEKDQNLRSRQILIFNTLGERVAEFNEMESNFQLDVSQLSSGVYVFKIQSKNDSYFKKFIIEN